MLALTILLKFDNVAEFEAFLESAYSYMELVEVTYNESQNVHSTELNFHIPWTLTEFNADINSNLETDASDYELVDVSSYLTGFSSLYGWKQTSYYSNIYESDSDEVFITIKGVHSFGITVGENGLDYSKSVIIVVNVNRKTGKLISYGWTN
ncbi:hypothetical protein [Jejuia spongiicola]|uniref:Uncharacterized protein n=1 Tax=Jejuia spongiicola TaxID=2942207 RepID=A0ABT0QJ91_9FLAO|nr:hypothetical protein [Jejuia spongiicola]MCL6296718.1 hypothetical protein [Jejuia spongiicola]